MSENGRYSIGDRVKWAYEVDGETDVDPASYVGTVVEPEAVFNNTKKVQVRFDDGSVEWVEYAHIKGV
jgi:hypothetical protein